MDTKTSANLEILAMFLTLKEKRIKLYESFLEDIDQFECWAVPLERLIAYYITLQNQKIYSSDLKEKIQKEIIQLNEGDFKPS